MHDYKKIETTVQKIRRRPPKELRAAAMKILENAPLFDIEAASSCNISCSFCPRTKLKRPANIMPPKIFEHVLKILPNNATVMFAGLGEPLINPHLPTYIKQLKIRNISSCVITNGILLTPKLQEQLIESGINQLQISYSGVSNDSVISIMGSTKYKNNKFPRGKPRGIQKRRNCAS